MKTTHDSIEQTATRCGTKKQVTMTGQPSPNIIILIKSTGIKWVLLVVHPKGVRNGHKKLVGTEEIIWKI
jgi:hypothetical protein